MGEEKGQSVPTVPPAASELDATQAASGELDVTGSSAAGSDPAQAETLATTSPPSLKPLDGLCGRRLQHFQVISRIGAGGMGTVYRARDLSLDRIVALKVLPKDKLDDPTLDDRFVREARAQARLSHPNVVPIYYVGEQEGLRFFAMECVEGESLADRVARVDRLESPVVIEQMIAVASALELAHRRGFIHRDIKPSNLLIDAGGTVKVADFGLAKSVEESDDDVQLTRRGAVLGSPLYMSPEQGQGDAVDHRSDIYSLGATFYHLLLGAPPFRAKTPVGVITKHITQPLPPVRDQRPGVNSKLATIIERMLQKDPAARYQSYAELISALRAARPKEQAPAGFWVRAMAFGADWVLLAILAAFIGPLVWPTYGLYFVIGWWRFGRTLGKWVFRLRLEATDGGLLSLSRCALRFAVLNWGPLLNVALGGLQWLLVGSANVEIKRELLNDGGKLMLVVAHTLVGLLYAGTLVWTGFRRDRRAVHDRVANTRVVYDLGQERVHRALS